MIHTHLSIIMTLISSCHENHTVFKYVDHLGRWWKPLWYVAKQLHNVFSSVYSQASECSLLALSYLTEHQKLISIYFMSVMTYLRKTCSQYWWVMFAIHFTCCFGGEKMNKIQILWKRAVFICQPCLCVHHLLNSHSYNKK